MNRILCTLAVGVSLGSAVTLGLVVWIQGCLRNAVAQGAGAGTPSGNGDVNGDGKLNLADAIYIINSQFYGGPAPVPIDCAQARLSATGQTKCYDVIDPDNGISAKEIPCDSVDYPGQDGAYQAGCPSEGRFVDNGDGTVTDLCTGLQWQKDTADVNGDGTIDPEWEGTDTLNWGAALRYCDGLSFAGHDDWRLPNVRELQSIADYGRVNPAIDPVFGALSQWSWSSTSHGSSPNSAWILAFHYGNVSYYGKDGRGHVRAVRSLP